MSKRSLNKVQLIGNLGKDPELRHTHSDPETGVPVCSFSLATNESWTDGDGREHDKTEWHHIIAWRGLANVCGQYLKKGDSVYIEGKLQTRSWEDQSGQKRYTTEIVADQMIMLGNKQQPSTENAHNFYEKTEQNTDTGVDEDIPF